jgi:lon-related putative ATP-dependent protease
MPGELSPAQLRRVCPPDRFGFQSTAELPQVEDIIGQPRGTRAIEFGIGISSPGFNIFIMGPAGTGRETAVARFLRQRAASEPTPPDWVYVYNFAEPRRPRALSLPPGAGSRLQDDMRTLVEDLERELPRAFEAEAYTEAAERIQRTLEDENNAAFEALRAGAATRNFTFLQSPSGPVLAPVLADGQVMPPDVYEGLPEQERKQLDDTRHELQGALEDMLRAVHKRQKAVKEQMRGLQRQVAATVVDREIADFRAAYADLEPVATYLAEARDDIVDHVGAFLPREEGQPPPEEPLRPGEPPGVRRYAVNLLVDSSHVQGAPVLVADNPTYPYLIGRIEHEVHYGALMTDFTLIKGGDLHRANGGYLVIHAQDVLRDTFAWNALKRALEHRRVAIEELNPAAPAVPTLTLEPEPIPLDTKVILLGNPQYYHWLYEQDEDFRHQFIVRADFDVEMDRTPENEELVAMFIAARCHSEGLTHFDPGGVAKVVEHASRLAGDQEKLSTRFGPIADLLREASYWAQRNGHTLVTAADVRQALDEQMQRSNLLEERERELVRDGILFIDTEGMVTGQVNGLAAVLQIGDYAFGQPQRISARAYMGRAGIINIEREVALAGPIHNKGLMILTGYLGGQYAQDQPLTLSAQITFEQSYGGIEGDSASSAELYALLSSLSGCAVRQDIAVTGSINQKGEIQPIGGATEKVEGFYAICQARGLTGTQGVMIPAANVRHLMLREEIVQAVADGQYHVWPVATIDEGLELLTGVPAGERGADGAYTEGSVHHAAQSRLREWAEGIARFEHPHAITGP